MVVKVISLVRSVERRHAFSYQNKSLEYEFVDATDGSNLSTQQIEESKMFASNLAYSKGAYGCAMSHIRMWQRSVEQQESLTIAEDDAIFRGDFEETQRKCFQNLVEDWDFVLWGWNFDSVLLLNAMREISPVAILFNQDVMRTAVDQFKQSSPAVSFYRLDKCFGIPCYSISPSGAKKLLEKCTPLKKFEQYYPGENRLLSNTGIDIAMNQSYAEINAFACFPPLVITRNEHEISTIQGENSN